MFPCEFCEIFFTEQIWTNASENLTFNIFNIFHSFQNRFSSSNTSRNFKHSDRSILQLFTFNFGKRSRISSLLLGSWKMNTFFPYLSSVLRQKGEYQNGGKKKGKHAKFSEKLTFLTPCTRMSHFAISVTPCNIILSHFVTPATTL